MRTLRLARIAAEAEGLRLRHQVRRTATRLVFAIIGLFFVAGAAAFAHIAAWCWLRLYWEPQYTALTLAGADLVLAACFALLAARSSPGRVELEALAIRQRAWESATGTVALSALVMQLLRLLTSLFSRRRSSG